jgi:hypothetical protein
MMFLAIRSHYSSVARQLSLDGMEPSPPVGTTVLVLVGDLHRGSVQACAVRPGAVAGRQGGLRRGRPGADASAGGALGQVGDGGAAGGPDLAYRSLLGPLVDSIDHQRQQSPNHMVTLVFPESIPARWWQQLRHNQTALLIKGAMLFRRNVVVTDVPYHLKD